MEVVVARCAGLDVHQKTVMACVRLPGEGDRRTEKVKEFSTFTAGLLALRQWLVELGVTSVVMEATGVYWRPVWHVLDESDMTLMLVNAYHVKKVPGRKTDVSDAQWLAQLLEHGLLNGSFVPPAEIAQLRDLTRYRKKLVEDRSREVQRVQKLLEDANIKLASVASDVLGVSGRAMLDMLVNGVLSSPEQLAELAKGKLRAKLAQLEQALTGRFGEHHRVMLREHLAHIDHLSASITRLDGQVDTLLAPFADQRDRLTTIPGVGKRTAEVLIAELGVDMSQFPTARHAASWAGMCPGNHESAGKHKSGKTRPGNSHLKSALIEAGWAASRSKGSYLSAQYYRLLRRHGRRGQKQALVGVGHSILIIAYHLLQNGTVYQDLGPDYFQNRQDTKALQKNLISRLESLGLHVTVEATTAA